MRKIKASTAFRKDFKKQKSGINREFLARVFEEVILMLQDDYPLPARLRDHPLAGNWLGYRELHLKGDLLLIYRFPDSHTLYLARLGSHSDLFD